MKIYYKFIFSAVLLIFGNSLSCNYSQRSEISINEHLRDYIDNIIQLLSGVKPGFMHEGIMCRNCKAIFKYTMFSGYLIGAKRHKDFEFWLSLLHKKNCEDIQHFALECARTPIFCFECGSCDWTV